MFFAAEIGSKIAHENIIFLMQNHRFLVKKYSTQLFKYTKRLVSMGSKSKMYFLGDLYYYGIGTEKCYKNAFTCYITGSTFSNAKSMYNLSYMYEYGLGCKRNYFKAINLIKTMNLASHSFYLLCWFSLAKILIEFVFYSLYQYLYIISTVFIMTLTTFLLFYYRNKNE